MIVLDVNVVVAVHRDDHPHHGLVRPWFDELVEGDERFTVPDVAWASFVRISTNRRVFELPTPTAEAFAFMGSVRAQRGYEAIGTAERHVQLFEQLCLAHDVSGNLVTDAYLAAIALEQGARFATLDGDFARFGQLEVVRPTLDAS